MFRIHRGMTRTIVAKCVSKTALEIHLITLRNIQLDYFVPLV